MQTYWKSIYVYETETQFSSLLTHFHIVCIFCHNIFFKSEIQHHHSLTKTHFNTCIYFGKQILVLQIDHNMTTVLVILLVCLIGFSTQIQTFYNFKVYYHKILKTLRLIDYYLYKTRMCYTSTRLQNVDGKYQHVGL